MSRAHAPPLCEAALAGSSRHLARAASAAARWLWKAWNAGYCQRSRSAAGLTLPCRTAPAAGARRPFIAVRTAFDNCTRSAPMPTALALLTRYQRTHPLSHPTYITAAYYLRVHSPSCFTRSRPSHLEPSPPARRSRLDLACQPGARMPGMHLTLLPLAHTHPPLGTAPLLKAAAPPPLRIPPVPAAAPSRCLRRL